MSTQQLTEDGLPDIRLSDLLARTVSEGDCLLWTGRAVKGKFPQWELGGKRYITRRLVYQVVHGPLPSRMQVGTRCKNPLCVHPDCLVARTASKAQRGRTMHPAHKARLTAALRARSPLTAEIIQAIRASVEPGPVLEARYGLKKGRASRIRSYESWKDIANPFAGLLPR
jgi:hypothetical protein